MKIKLTTDNLKKIYKVCKKGLPKPRDMSRQVFQYIQLICKDNICQAFSSNTYKIHSVIVPYEGDVGKLLIPIVNIPKSTYVIISQDNKNLTFSFQGAETRNISLPKIDLDYPDFTRIIPKKEPVFQIYFNPRYLKEAAEGLMGEKVELNFYGMNEPCLMKTLTEDSFALILPLRRDR
ncbi:MAG: hypothetical protein GX248_09735 [Peptococcaceae bacterium]|jgi:DNA polymerase III sliding clamp (beta) subunit (PCNA family)|nr:hypothetical protein [Peptococcaceae bacterium]